MNKYHPSDPRFFRHIRIAANRCGRPVGYGVLEDLDRMDIENVRCFVLPLAFRFSEKEEKILREKVCRPGNTVIWFYAPGIISRDGKWDEAGVEKYCGVPYGTTGIVKKAMPGGWTSVYVQDPDDFKVDVFTSVLDETPVHKWSDPPRPVFANAHFAAVHTGEAGTIKFSFPAECREVEELFSGEKWENVQSLELKSEGPMTWLFRYER